MASLSAAPKTEFWRSSSHFVQRRGALTAERLQTIQRWVAARVGQSPSLLIEHASGRNRVRLRLGLGHFSMVAEVSALRTLRSQDPKATKEAILALFEAG